jgi:hypothetical protein
MTQSGHRLSSKACCRPTVLDCRLTVRVLLLQSIIHFRLNASDYAKKARNNALVAAQRLPKINTKLDFAS